MKDILHKALIVSLTILTLVSVQVFAAAPNRAGTNAAPELTIPVGARYIGMGGASTANVSGLDAIYWNPAGIDRMSYRAGVMFSQMTYIADISLSYVSLAAKFPGVGSVGLSFKSLGMGDIAITTEDQPDGTGAKFSPQFITVGLSYSRALTDRVAVGASVKLISETIDRVSASGIAFDIGVQYQDLGDVKGLSIGVVLKNLGPGMKFDGNGLLRKADPLDVERSSSFYKIVAGTDELPSTLDIGLSYKLVLPANNSIDFQTTFVNHNYDDDYANLGAEYSFSNMVFVRGGYAMPLTNREDATGANPHIFGFAVGGGFKYDFGGVTMAIDYAYRDVEYFSGNNVFSIALGF